MTNPSMNCLSEGETLDDLARRECAIGFDLRFCRSVAISPNDRDTETCDPTEAEFATLYALTDLGEPEQKKEKRRKKEAKAAQQNSSWWMPFQ